MTDKEILQALKICSTYGAKCTDCPAYVKVDRSKCKEVLKGAIEMIERLQKDLTFAREMLELERAKNERINTRLTEYCERLAGEAE